MLISRTCPDEISRLASLTLKENRVGIFIVCYNAERHIDEVLGRIPAWVSSKLAEVFVIDDSSGDGTVRRAVDTDWTKTNATLESH